MKKYISYILAITLMVTSFMAVPFIKKDNTVYAGEGELHYHLDMGVYVAAKSNGSWADGIPYNTVQPYRAGLDFPNQIKVHRIMSLAQADAEGLNIWKEKYFTHNMPLKGGELSEEGYQRIYFDYISPDISGHTVLSNQGNNLQFSLNALLKGREYDYNLIERYKDKSEKVTTVKQIVIKDNQTATAIKSLMTEKAVLKMQIDMWNISAEQIITPEQKQKTAERYAIVLKQLELLSLKPNYTTVDKVIESYKLDEKGFIEEVYKFWGGPEGLQATNGNMYTMMKNMEQGKVNLDDEYYLVFIPTVIEYEITGKMCSICGQCPLPQSAADDYCTKDNCTNSGKPECGCYTEPVAQVTPPADTTGSCTDTIKWSEKQSHTYKCGGCKTKKNSKGKKTKYCPGHTCNHVYTYQSRLSSSASLAAAKPNGNSTTFKSGYGFSVNLNNSIATSQIGNSGACGKSLTKANSKKPTPPSAAEVRTNWTVKLKDSKVTQPKTVALAKGASTGTTSKFVTASNPLSNYRNAQIYTDVALKGTKQKPIKHTVNVYTYGGGVNGVQFCKNIPLLFTINGNMYEDDWTVDRLPR